VSRARGAGRAANGRRGGGILHAGWCARDPDLVGWSSGSTGIRDSRTTEYAKEQNIHRSRGDDHFRAVTDLVGIGSQLYDFPRSETGADDR